MRVCLTPGNLSNRLSSLRRLLPAGLLGLLAVGCSGGGGGGSAGAAGDFFVLSTNVVTGQTWKINRPIELVFSQDVDFSTVNLGTVRVVDDTGISAIGFFYQPTDDATGQVDRRRVVFQPRCPSEDDFGDGGLLPGTDYSLIVAANPGAPTLRSLAGEPLTGGLLRQFHTPDSDDASDLFIDTVAGPPLVLILPTRPQPGEPIDPDTPATHVVIGGLKRFFGRDQVTQEGRLEPGLSLPLNHYSLPENQVAFVLQFNQPVGSSTTNLARLALQYRDDTGQWQDVPSQVELEANCAEDGAVVRVLPRGILPQGHELRARVGQGFQDIVGDGTTAPAEQFALAETLVGGEPNPLFPDVDNPEVDEVLEGFEESGLEDQDAVFPVPSAEWKDGRLEASFAFGGTGGPGGNFDWHVPPSTELVLDTTSDVIFGGPGGAQTDSQPVIGGVVDVRNFLLPSSSIVRIVGPNTCTILASGWMRIEGMVILSGADNAGVGTINTANQPEPGSAGQAGGGDGGTGSPFTTQSTPQGGAGFGAFQVFGQGGGGGETSYGKSNFRGAGGGGGRFGADVYYDHDDLGSTGLVRCQMLIGLDGEYGNVGAINGKGALGNDRAQGGVLGPSPFKDNDPDNDFLGTKLTVDGELISGELEDVWAGGGGGGGGDSVNSDVFPHPNFGPTTDQKGAGAGGGAGGLELLAIGSITVGSEEVQGRVVAEGGAGAGGEQGLLRIGGGSGGGAGGHLVLSSADRIVIHGKAASAGPWYKDSGEDHLPRVLSAVGGQGGTGALNKGGSIAGSTTKWSCDRVPFPFLEYPDVPPIQEDCFKKLPNTGDPEGPCDAAGGDGGPGLIQLHVEDPGDLIFPTLETELGGTYATGLDVTYACAPPPVGWKAPGVVPDQMIPFFGRNSMARSRWIPLGLARVDASGGLDLVALHGQGGVIPHAPEETVELLPPIVGPEVLPEVGWHVSLDASGLAPEDERYAENAALLRQATVRLSDSLDPDNRRHFVIADAAYDEAADRFELDLDQAGPNPAAFQAAGDVEAALVPHLVRVETAGVPDAYPANNDIEILWDATVVDPFTGGPSESDSYSAQNGSLTDDLDELGQTHWDFVRFQVRFDLNTGGGAVDPTAPRPALDMLRVQFEF